MDYISLVDTSLDLNSNPLRLIEETPPNKEVQRNFIGLGIKNMPVKEEANALVEELNRVNAENKKLTEMLTVLCENYNALRSHLMDHIEKNPREEQVVVSRKRKSESTSTIITATNNGNKDVTNMGNSVSSSSDNEDSTCKKPRQEHVKTKISRVYVRTEAADTTLVVKDGYQWRKYGQKVTRDNPCPRAYFKCSFAPTCPVKKKVQRSIEDQSILVATYEGEHNHPHPNSSSNRGLTLSSVPCSATTGPTVTLDLTKPKSNNNIDAKNSSRTTTNAPEFQQFLVEQMASSLTKDPSFKAAVAAAISGRIIHHNQTEKW